MEIHKRARATWLSCLLMLAGGCALDVGDMDDLPHAEEQTDATPKSLSLENGLRSINGLSSSNGLRSVNGLSVSNGLRVSNGLVSINGLATKNASSTVNGRSVNCAGTTRCTGAPDGLLSARRGLLKDAEGVNLAGYLIRCALPADRTITVKTWDGQRVSMSGELGLAPEWETGQCETDCQEKVSACLLALVNGSGQHISITLSAAWANGPLGELPDPSLLREAVFFGNVFTDPPEAYVAIHRDWAQALRWRALSGRPRTDGTDLIAVPRMCSGVPGISASNYATQQDLCPIQIVGEAGQILWETDVPGIGSNYNLCFMADGLTHALLCRLNGSDYKWNFPLTTFVSNGVW